MVIEFKVRPWPRSRLYLLVSVSPTLAEMADEVRAWGGSPHPQAVAMCTTVTSRTERLKDMVGILFLCGEHGSMPIVQHEIAHAAFRVCDRLGVRVHHWERAEAGGRRTGTAAEERYASIVEHLTQSFWKGALRHGIANVQEARRPSEEVA